MLEVGEGQRDWREPALSIHGSSVRDVKLIEASSVSFGDPEATSELYFSMNSERSVLGATGAELQATSQMLHVMVHARSLGGKGIHRCWGSGHLIGKGLVGKEPVADVGLAWRQLSLVLSWLS